MLIAVAVLAFCLGFSLGSSIFIASADHYRRLWQEANGLCEEWDRWSDKAMKLINDLQNRNQPQ